MVRINIKKDVRVSDLVLQTFWHEIQYFPKNIGEDFKE
jgi:hypothetical protein